jgi:hypothetical protein
MIAAGVLGIALIGLVRLHTSAVRGTVQADSLGRGVEVARQLADTVATTSLAAAPAWLTACQPGRGAPLPQNSGCRTSAAGVRASGDGFAVHKGGCTFFSRGAAVPMPGDANNVPSVETGATRGLPAPQSGEFRIDVAYSAHPDPVAYPDAAVVTVWVCWLDGDSGSIREVETRRVLL